MLRYNFIPLHPPSRITDYYVSDSGWLDRESWKRRNITYPDWNRVLRLEGYRDMKIGMSLAGEIATIHPRSSCLFKQ
jgi:hypothetical protein